MFKERFGLAVLAVVLAQLVFTTALAKTWYLEQSGDWKDVSQDCKKAFVKADSLFDKGKLSKAARQYDKFLEECKDQNGLYTEALKRQFAIGREFLSGHKKRVLGFFTIKGYAEGVKIMERINKRAGNRQIGLEAVVEIAKSYEKRGRSDKTNYNLAYLEWKQIFETYDGQKRSLSSEPTGIIGKDALLGMARCKHLCYRGSQYDVSDLIGRAFSESPYDGAKGCYEQFVSLYPQEAKKLGVEDKLKQINEQLANKDLTIGRYYQKTGNKQSANLYYQMVITDLPDTKAAKLAKEMLVKGSSVKTKER